MEPTPNGELLIPAVVPAVIPAEVPGEEVPGEEDGGKLVDVAVTRSQKRKRDEEEALVVRSTSCVDAVKCFILFTSLSFPPSVHKTPQERKASGASAEALDATARAASSKGASGSTKVHQSPPHRPDDKVQQQQQFSLFFVFCAFFLLILIFFVLSPPSLTGRPPAVRAGRKHNPCL